MFMLAQQKPFTHLRVLLLLTDRGILAQSSYPNLIYLILLYSGPAVPAAYCLYISRLRLGRLACSMHNRP
jgi:hypothetical protein